MTQIEVKQSGTSRNVSLRTDRPPPWHRQNLITAFGHRTFHLTWKQSILRRCRRLSAV